MVLNKIMTYGRLVMFSHTIFSLSFALIAMLLAAEGLPSMEVIIWILVAFLGARTGANALNRLIDKEIDKKNPRTAGRHLPKGQVKIVEVIVIIIISFILLGIGAYQLNPLCYRLLPLAYFLLIIYSYTKRFTWACHIILGITCAAAPVGAWIAVRGTIEWPGIILGAANVFWVSGFDIMYGAQDIHFDKAHHIYSIPAYFGIKNALMISSLFHFITVGLFIYLFFITSFSWFYLIGIMIITILLIKEHTMVTANNLTNVKIASYNINQIVSIVFLFFSTIDILVIG